MTSETSNLHVLKNLNISKTKQADIKKLKMPLIKTRLEMLFWLKFDQRFFVAVAL